LLFRRIALHASLWAARPTDNEGADGLSAEETTMARLERDGVAIHYEQHGQGPAVLLSHGYSATCRMWDGQIAALKDRFQVIVWDMRGHGQSDYPTDPTAYSEAATVEDMAAILRACGATRAVIGGLSLGGYMSLAFHKAHPEMTRALMIFDTGPGFRNAEAREAWNHRALQRADDLDARGLAALGSSDEVRMSQHRDASGLAGAARGMLTQRDDAVFRSLETIAVPSLVLVGSEDTNFLAATDYMARKIAGAEKVVIDGAGHASNLHQPAAFNRAVEAFLGRLPT
jgi:pimeloyl-ACP methyl ester carboxylesterase